MELRLEVKALMRACQTLIESIKHADNALNKDERTVILDHLSELALHAAPDSELKSKLSK